MERWVLYALISMIFAGLTSVVAKQGLDGISGDLGLAVRTVFIFALTLGFAAFSVPVAELGRLTWRNGLWLALSAATTVASWIFYYRALKMGEVSTIALIDKGSFLVAVALAWMFLGERMTWRMGLGSALILAGLIVVSRK